ncbi:proline--tRNA ligase [Candidatus Woesearchaeota archaeon]|jgi:prolyl-tRNA synthetase|nr:proline--tRNA ligase [Candidatus Woesearchaeota archaeon]|tara:strand:- start:15582 stop:17024 length:1443 start_codon:yes stop_codon:yes gene_type:complete
MEEKLGLNVKKSEDFNEWYNQVVLKADMIDYSSVSGCIVFKPNSYSIWEKIQRIFDDKIKRSGHKNCYFPMFIPESLLKKEADHFEGFTPEVAWVTRGGNSELQEKLAIRPTSETVMYESYAKWIRSWRDLPLLLNQWNSVVRWEFKHAKPFLRTREFLWQEGHTAHATKEEAEKEVMQQLFEYTDLIETFMAIPVIAGKKTEKEKFAGADYTTAVEAFMPDGKALQMGTSHFLGQNFSKPFGIKFLDKDEKEKFAWTTSWGLSTRTIGAIVMVHGDDKGLVLPPKIAPIQFVVVPIVFKGNKDPIVAKAKDIIKKLRSKNYNVLLDDRDGYTPGWKFNEWELKGIPLRIEIGPKEVEADKLVIVRRDTNEKIEIKTKDWEKKIEQALDDMQDSMFKKAKEYLTKSIVEVKNFDDFIKAIKDKKMAKVLFCGSMGCEDLIKDKAEGASCRCIPFEQKQAQGKCVQCGKEAKSWAVFGKSY